MHPWVTVAIQGSTCASQGQGHALSKTEKCQFITEKCQFITEKCQFITDLLRRNLLPPKALDRCRSKVKTDISQSKTDISQSKTDISLKMTFLSLK
jgi:hypothetical protein